MHAADLGILFPASIRPEPWANGLGTTRVMTEQPTWRLSIADIEGRMDFSSFPGRDRVLMPLASASVELEIGATAHAVTSGEAIAFRGEDRVAADTHGRRVSVLNVMATRERARIEWDITGRTGPLSTGSHPTVVLSGDVEVDGRRLPPGTVLFTTGRRRVLQCADAVLARIRVCRRG